MAHQLVSAFPNEDFTLRRPVTVSLPVIKHKQVVNATVTQQPQWGVAKIGAPAAWATTTGEGSVVGIIDTGVYLGHSALQAGYAGAWHDPYYNRPGPTDSQGHGTHCAGTVVGRANGIGVAPGGRWIACRGLDNEGSGTETNLIRCAEFMLTANPLPHVVSCSWGGGQGDTFYNQVVQAWREASIIPVFAIGNDGSWCRTAISPGDQRNLIGVGATTRLWDSITTFSSRGPNIVFDPERIKPDMAAPGEEITSADALQGGYVQMSGTSMAAPHVAGAILLLQAANNHSLTYDQVYDALASTAFRGELINGDRNCGLPTPGTDFPNYAWGYGRISVGDAINTDFSVKK